MKNFMSLIMLLVLFVLAWTAAPAQTYTGNVVQWLDGDTVQFRAIGGKQYRIRLAGIDAPESHQTQGLICKQLLKDATAGQSVTAELLGVDIYSRYIGRLSTAAKPDVQLYMIQSGCAWEYSSAIERKASYQAAEQTARIAHVGLWLEPFPTPPWIFRRQGALPAFVYTCP